MGNREKQLEKPNVVAIFAGLAFGVIIGAFPIAFPYMPVTIQLGLAGGPLIAAILLGYFGPRFHLVTYTTHSANPNREVLVEHPAKRPAIEWKFMR